MLLSIKFSSSINCTSLLTAACKVYLKTGIRKTWSKNNMKHNCLLIYDFLRFLLVLYICSQSTTIECPLSAVSLKTITGFIDQRKRVLKFFFPIVTVYLEKITIDFMGCFIVWLGVKKFNKSSSKWEKRLVNYLFFGQL